MTTVKFDKSVKYQGVRYAAHEAFQVSDEDVAQLKASGATVLSVDTVAPPAPPVTGEEDSDTEGQVAGEEEEKEGDEDVAQLKEKLLDYTVPELVKFAEERGIDLQKKTKKAEIYNIIIASLN